ncbi:MAG: SusD/RagB family nutrient-binding outer membrane lipoprotein [Bacteroidota bacterium]
MKKLLILLTVLLVLGTSCKDDFLSVNEFNPNSASAVPANLVLPAALNTTSRIVTTPGNYPFVYLWYGCMSISGSYSQPTDLTQYNLLNSSYQGNWNNSYLNLQNYDYIVKNSTTEKLKPYKAIAMIMKVYLYQNLVDAYGNVPYSEALRSADGILKPKYDAQQTVYEDLVVQLDAAMEQITSAPADADEVGAYDIIYNGDMDLWLKFANTLKLRILVNQSDMTGRGSYISGAIATTISNGFLGAGEGAMLNPGYLQSAGKMNPFWERFYKQDGSQQADGLSYFVAGQDACDFLTANNDPRKLRFFQANTSGGTAVKGNYFGALVLEPQITTSKLGAGMLQGYNQTSPILTDFESLFLQAEAVQRGIITGDAKALYESAVTQSIIYMGGSSGTTAAAATYLAQALMNVSFDASTNKVKAIITQKWVALNGLSPMPIWTDYRRTGFPDFLHFSADPARLNDIPPVRLLYPQAEISTNNDNVLAQGDISLFTSKIFWQNR